MGPISSPIKWGRVENSVLLFWEPSCVVPVLTPSSFPTPCRILGEQANIQQTDGDVGSQQLSPRGSAGGHTTYSLPSGRTLFFTTVGSLQSWEWWSQLSFSSRGSLFSSLLTGVWFTVLGDFKAAAPFPLRVVLTRLVIFTDLGHLGTRI